LSPRGRQAHGVPPAGLETLSASSLSNNNLRQSSLPADAQSGAVGAEAAPVQLTPEALAAAILALSPADRARLAALLVGEQPEGASK
jgi:hypothetical protein